MSIRDDTHKVGATVEKALDAALWRLKSGEIRLEDLTPALMGFYSIGHSDGIKSVAPQLEQAMADADRFYRAAYCPSPKVDIGPSYEQLQKIRADIYGGAK